MTMFGQIRDKIMESQQAQVMPDLSGAVPDSLKN